jgi:hypothetical protein
MTNQDTNVSMVVAERGSDWSGWAEQLRKGCPEVVVMQQLKGETVAAFVHRVRTRVAEIDRSGRTLHEAAIVGGGRTDSDAMAARSLAIRALVSPMVHAGGGRVFLGSAGRDRYAMLGLASAAAEMLRGTGVAVAPADSAPALAAA